MHIVESCPEIPETIQEFFRLHYHKMHIKRLGAILSHIFQDRKTERDVRNEHAVHYIKVKPVGLTTVYHLQFTAEVGKIRREE